MARTFLFLSLLLLLSANSYAEMPGDRSPRSMDPKKTAKFLKGEAKQVRSLLKRSDYETAHKTLVAAAESGIEQTGKDSPVGKWLEEALKEAGAERDVKDSSALLLGRIEKAAKALDFKLDEQAPLPKGFPQPTPPGIIEVKAYPKYRMASKKVQSGSETTESSMFMPLFHHIQRNNIPMSAPVETTYSTDESKGLKTLSMSFVYPDPATGKAGPERDVVVEDVGPLKVVSIGVSGAYTERNFRVPLRELQGWLARHSDQYTTAGAPRRLGYNSPFVLWYKKFSEVQIPIKMRSKEEPKTDRTPVDGAPPAHP